MNELYRVTDKLIARTKYSKLYYIYTTVYIIKLYIYILHLNGIILLSKIFQIHKYNCQKKKEFEQNL